MDEAGGEPIDLAAGYAAANEALRLSEYRYRNLFEAMAASFWELDFSEVAAIVKAIDASGVTDLRAHFAANPDVVAAMIEAARVIDVNEMSVALFGKGRDRAAFRTSLTPFWPKDSQHIFAESIVAAIGREANYSAETRLCTLDGDEIDVLFTVCFPPESKKKGTLLVGIIDVGERVRAQAALQQIQADLAHAARVSMLGELTASIAHEVNQPLAAIVTNGEAGLRWLARAEPDIGEVQALLARVVADGRRAAEIIAQIRSLAMNKAPERVLLSLNDVVEEAVMVLNHELTSKQVSLRLDLAAGLPDVLADRTQIQQVVVNLAMNAAQAMAHAERPRRELAIMTGRAADDMIVAVEDSGPGIAPEHIERLFESFFTTKSGGMGMGLPICRSIVEAHDGRIWVESVPDVRSIFRFTLPAAAVRA